MPRNYYNITAFACIFSLMIDSTANTANANDDLWDALKKGGKVVLMRHAEVEYGNGSGDPLLHDPSCKGEKNLSGKGRRNAELVGRRFREHKIPVSKVMHSPFCRTTDTARIAFGKAFPAEYLSLIEILGPEEAAKQTGTLNQLIDSHVDKGNLILVTHEPNIRAISFELVKHLDLLVIDPNDKDEFEELGVIRFFEPE